MKLINTSDPTVKPSVVMLVYGDGGVGKTTFVSTAPKVILADCENGSKYFGLRGIKVDVALIENWSDMREFFDLARTDKYETVAIDPIGELMDKLTRHMIAMNDSKLVQKDGSPTMAGWGWLKKTMRDYLKVLRDTGKNVIIIAHLEEKQDEDRMIKRPKVATKLSDEMVNMVDIVAYMTVTKDEDGNDKRILIVDPSNDKYVAKDRTGRLGKYVEPDFQKIINACQGTKTYAWSKPVDKVAEKPAEADPDVKEPVVTPEVTTEEVKNLEITEGLGLAPGDMPAAKTEKQSPVGSEDNPIDVNMDLGTGSKEDADKRTETVVTADNEQVTATQAKLAEAMNK